MWHGRMTVVDECLSLLTKIGPKFIAVPLIPQVAQLWQKDRASSAISKKRG